MSAYLEIVPFHARYQPADMPAYCSTLADDLKARLVDAGYTVTAATADVKHDTIIDGTDFVGDVIVVRGEIAEDIGTDSPHIARPRKV